MKKIILLLLLLVATNVHALSFTPADFLIGGRYDLNDATKQITFRDKVRLNYGMTGAEYKVAFDSILSKASTDFKASYKSIFNNFTLISKDSYKAGNNLYEMQYSSLLMINESVSFAIQLIDYKYLDTEAQITARLNIVNTIERINNSYSHFNNAWYRINKNIIDLKIDSLVTVLSMPMDLATGSIKLVGRTTLDDSYDGAIDATVDLGDAVYTLFNFGKALRQIIKLSKVAVVATNLDFKKVVTGLDYQTNKLWLDIFAKNKSLEKFVSKYRMSYLRSSYIRKTIKNNKEAFFTYQRIMKFTNNNYLSLRPFLQKNLNDLAYFFGTDGVNEVIKIILEKDNGYSNVLSNFHLSSPVFVKNTKTITLFSDFSDFPKGSFAYRYVNELRTSGIIKGYPDGTFKPSRCVSIGEFLKMATKSIYGRSHKAKLNEIVNSQNYAFSKYVIFLKDIGVNVALTESDYIVIKQGECDLEKAVASVEITDYNNNVLKKVASRGYVAKVLANMIEHKKINYSKCTKTGINDWDICSERLRQAAIANGAFIEGEYFFEPGKSVKRDQVSKMIYKTLYYKERLH